MKSRGKKLERLYDQIFDYWTHNVPHRPPSLVADLYYRGTEYTSAVTIAGPSKKNTPLISRRLALHNSMK